MDLFSSDGTRVRLRPVSYQFPDSTEEWDANWLVIAGSVRLPGGPDWSFEEPCLTTWEARALGEWLRAAGSAPVVPGPWQEVWDDGAPEGVLTFTEPNLSFRRAGPATVVVRFGYESAPSHLFVDVRLDVGADGWVASGSGWARELVGFPPR